MIIHLLIGALAATVMVWLYTSTQKHAISVAWWQWGLTVLGLFYAVFVLEVIVGFLGEGAPQAALVMGLLTGIIAIVWGVLLKRFVFVNK